MIRIAFITSVVVATAGISTAFAMGSLWIPAAAVVVLGPLWVLGHKLQLPWLAWAMMGLYTVGGAVGAWLELRPVFILVGFTAAVSAWDLDHLLGQLGGVDRVEQRATLSRRHLRRVILVDVVSLIAALAAINLRIEFSFAVAVLLGLVALIGLSRVVSLIARGEGA